MRKFHPVSFLVAMLMALWRTFWDVFFFVSKVVLLIAFFALLAIGLQQAGALK